MKVVAIIQARMGSTRLPGKVLSDVAGEPMLVRVVRRCRRAKLVDQVVVATTVEGGDDPVHGLCESRNWPYFRGSEADVLDRYYQAALHFGAHSVVRITADCPLIEPTVIDQAIEVFRSNRPDVDYVSNTLPPRTYPRGLDVEVMSRTALTRAWHEDDQRTSREHVTPYIWRHPDQFHLLAIRSEKDYSHMRWTVDTSEDMSFVRQVYTHFGGDDFSWQDVLDLLSQRPELHAINRHILQKEV